MHALHARGNTALYDAVIFACDKLRRRQADVITRPVIVLITDDDDNSSKSILYDAQQAAARAAAILFALSTNVVDSGYYPKGEAVLEGGTPSVRRIRFGAIFDQPLSDVRSSLPCTLCRSL